MANRILRYILDLPGMLHRVIPRMPLPLTLRIRNTELVVVVPEEGRYVVGTNVLGLSPAQCPA